jgi:hypothetical protein
MAALQLGATAAAKLLDELLTLAGKGGAAAGGPSDENKDRGGAYENVHGRFEDQDGALCAAGFVAASGLEFPEAGPCRLTVSTLNPKPQCLNPES